MLPNSYGNDMRVVVLLLGVVAALARLQVSSVRGLTKEFVRPPPLGLPFLQETRVQALRKVSLEFSRPVTTLVGTSGSGKSTLAKLLCGVETPSSGSIDRCSEGRGAYLDPLFYLSYASSRTTTELLTRPSTPSPVLELHRLLGIPDLIANSLLTSERRSFEVLLAIARTMSADPPMNPPLLVLDEYLDKDLSSTLTQFQRTLRLITSTLELQTIVVTHSKAVLGVLNEDVVALSGGRVFSRGLDGALPRLPSELEMV